KSPLGYVFMLNILDVECKTYRYGADSLNNRVREYPRRYLHTCRNRLPMVHRSLIRLHCNSRLVTESASSLNVKERVRYWDQNWGGCKQGFHNLEMLLTIYF